MNTISFYWLQYNSQVNLILIFLNSQMLTNISNITHSSTLYPPRSPACSSTCYHPTSILSQNIPNFIKQNNFQSSITDSFPSKAKKSHQSLNKIKSKKSVIIIEMNENDDPHHHQQRHNRKAVLELSEKQVQLDAHIYGNRDSVMINPEKILLPVKEYSNKFLRDKKARQDVCGTQNFLHLKNKKSVLYMRKQTRKNKALKTESSKSKQIHLHSLHTEASRHYCDTESFSGSKPKNSDFYHLISKDSDQLAQTPSSDQLYQNKSNLYSSADKTNKISTSRALQKFSKVYKNQGIQRMRIRREVIVHKTTDVQVRQMRLQNKSQKKQNHPTLLTKTKDEFLQSKQTKRYSEKLKEDINKMKGRRRNINKKKQVPAPSLFDDDNFEIVGW